MKINTVSWKVKVHYMRILITYKWKKVYNNSLIGSPLIVHAILKNVVLRKRASKFSDGEKNLPLAPRKPLLGTLPSKLFRYGL